MNNKETYLKYVKEKADEYADDKDISIREAECKFAVNGFTSDQLDLECDMIIDEYRSNCWCLIDAAFDRGCTTEDLYPIFGEWLVDN